LELYETRTYEVPQTYDPDGNTDTVVSIAPNERFEELFPAFLDYNTQTRELFFYPDTVWVRGRKYYFKYVVKESTTDLKTEYHATIQINGKPATEITYSINDVYQPNVLKPLEGTISFSHNINTFWLTDEDNIFDLFDIYTQADVEAWPQPVPNEDFVVTSFGQQSISFQVIFEENVKTEGFLVIDIKEFLDYDEVFYGNVSETRFANQQAYSYF
jgi:hypothetical protein